VLQDVLTIHGSQFKNAALIVASPPCEAYSYMAMPWSKAKQQIRDYERGVRDVKQLTALFDACFRIQREASEAAGHVIPMVVENVRGAQRWVGRARWHFGSFYLWGDIPALMPHGAALKGAGDGWFNDAKRKGGSETGRLSQSGSRSPARKAASAMIAKIPLALSRHIARIYYPRMTL